MLWIYNTQLGNPPGIYRLQFPRFVYTRQWRIPFSNSYGATRLIDSIDPVQPVYSGFKPICRFFSVEVREESWFSESRTGKRASLYPHLCVTESTRFSITACVHVMISPSRQAAP
jgi:hypothetical protein